MYTLDQMPGRHRAIPSVSSGRPRVKACELYILFCEFDCAREALNLFSFSRAHDDHVAGANETGSEDEEKER